MRKQQLFWLSATLLLVAGLLTSPRTLGSGRADAREKVSAHSRPTSLQLAAMEFKTTEALRRSVRTMELRDPAFARYVDLRLLPSAVVRNDAALLTDLALALAFAESVLARPHKAICANDVVRLALPAADETGDAASLDRLARFAAKRRDGPLSALLAVAKQHASNRSAEISTNAAVAQDAGIPPGAVPREQRVAINFAQAGQAPAQAAPAQPAGAQPAPLAPALFQLTVINETGKDVFVYWDIDGEPQPYQIIAANQSNVISSYAGQTWGALIKGGANAPEFVMPASDMTWHLQEPPATTPGIGSARPTATQPAAAAQITPTPPPTLHKLTVINDTEAQVSIFYLDNNGKAVPYQILLEGQNNTYQSYGGQKWRVVRADNQKQINYTMPEKDATLRLESAKNTAITQPLQDSLKVVPVGQAYWVNLMRAGQPYSYGPYATLAAANQELVVLSIQFQITIVVPPPQAQPAPPGQPQPGQPTAQPQPGQPQSGQPTVQPQPAQPQPGQPQPGRPQPGQPTAQPQPAQPQPGQPTAQPQPGRPQPGQPPAPVQPAPPANIVTTISTPFRANGTRCAPIEGPNPQTFPGQTDSELSATLSLRRGSCLRVLSMRGYVDGNGVRRHDITFMYYSVPQCTYTILEAGADARFAAIDQEYKAKGYQRVINSEFDSGGQNLHDAVWELCPPNNMPAADVLEAEPKVTPLNPLPDSQTITDDDLWNLWALWSMQSGGMDHFPLEPRNPYYQYPYPRGDVPPPPPPSPPHGPGAAYSPYFDPTSPPHGPGAGYSPYSDPPPPPPPPQANVPMHTIPSALTDPTNQIDPVDVVQIGDGSGGNDGSDGSDDPGPMAPNPGPSDPPMGHDPGSQDPGATATDPGPSDPSMGADPGSQDPGATATDPGPSDPSMGADPGSQDPGATATDPGASDPAMGADPGAGVSGAYDPGASDPNAYDPGANAPDYDTGDSGDVDDGDYGDGGGDGGDGGG